jgi:hypothetical protein
MGRYKAVTDATRRAAAEAVSGREAASLFAGWGAIKSPVKRT